MLYKFLLLASVSGGAGIHDDDDDDDDDASGGEDIAPDHDTERMLTMPIIRIDMLLGRTSLQKLEIARVFSEEMARIARCEVDDVQIIFNEAPKDSWAVGGQMVSDKAD
jgi:4-oxalocrotonate tautomerase